ncbi:MAG: thiosulfate/3-mercaptopyruvate sulfurtransferase [Alphaproteobacteria bacterium]|jgi:thiosulfate/3-mercaptopyruvate sulfurtransferase
MNYKNQSSLVDCEWLTNRLKLPNVKLVDASWYLPDTGRNARAEYRAERIPGAMFLDIELVSDPAAPHPHTVVEPMIFSDEVTALGIERSDHVVIYDGMGLFSAPRVWWMFKIYGYDKVSVLNGGFPKWKAEGRQIETNQPEMPVPTVPFEVGFRPKMMRILPQMVENVKTGQEHVLDARGPGRFQGTDPEPREGVRSGHIPGSANMPYAALMDPDTGLIKDADALAALYAEAGVRDDKGVVCSCGSGITACALAFGLHLLGRDDVAVYDGSWSEWGSQPDTPVETGP